MFTAPINTTLTMSVNGMVTLRSYRKFHHFREDFMEAIEKSANSTFCYNALNRFIGIRLDFLCVAFGTSTAALSIFLKNSVDPELLTFSLQVVTDIIVLFSIAVRMYAETENMMTSSQRIYQYTNLEEEDKLTHESDKQL